MFHVTNTWMASMRLTSRPAFLFHWCHSSLTQPVPALAWKYTLEVDFWMKQMTSILRFWQIFQKILLPILLNLFKNFSKLHLDLSYLFLVSMWKVNYGKKGFSSLNVKSQLWQKKIFQLFHDPATSQIYIPILCKLFLAFPNLFNFDPNSALKPIQLN